MNRTKERAEIALLRHKHKHTVVSGGLGQITCHFECFTQHDRMERVAGVKYDDLSEHYTVYTRANATT